MRTCRSSEVSSFRLKHSLPASLSVFHSGVSPVSGSAVDARLAELQHYMQRETDALVLARDVVKQLQGISSLDQKALAEVGLPVHFIFNQVEIDARWQFRVLRCLEG